MWYVERNKEQLVEFFHSRIPIAASDFDAIHTDQDFDATVGKVRLVWSKRPNEGDLPSLIIVNEHEMQEFFAWINTYLRGWRPISSLIRVVSGGNGGAFVSRDSTSLVGFEDALLGLVLGEALTHIAFGYRTAERAKVSMSACMATCSFGFGRLMGLGMQFKQKVGENWFRTRELVKQPIEMIEVQTIVDPWIVLAAMRGVDTDRLGTRTVPRAVFEMCESIRVNGLVDNRSLTSITKGWPDLREAFEHMDGPWEERINTVERALRATMRRRRRLPESVAFGCGLLASRVSPGTLDHANILLPYLRHASGLLLWYGLCAGLTRGSRLVEFSENLGRRILQTMLSEDSVFSRPRCDISLEELEVVSMATSALANLQTGIPGQLTIETFPCVNTAVRWPGSERRRVDIQRSLFDQDATEIGDVIGDLNLALDKARRRLSEMGGRRR